MKQSIHIFLKDARFLRIEICLFVVVAAVFAWAGPGSGSPYGVQSGAEILIEIAAVYLIARVVHAEAIPGDRQFWLTRPYNWKSLAGAKLLFIATFVCLPICAAQIAMLVAGGFPLLSSLPGLVWSQVLIFFVGSALAAAVAAITSGTVIFMLAVLGLAAAAMIAEVISPMAAAFIYHSPVPGLEWIRDYAVLTIFSLSAAFILLQQYRNRATTFSRMAGIGGIILAIAALLWMPPAFIFGVQSWFSRMPAASTGVQVSIDPSLKGTGTWLSGGKDKEYRKVRIPLPIAVRGLPRGVEARAEALSVSFDWTGEPGWKPDVAPGVNPRSNARGVSLSDATVLMEPALYWTNRNLPMTMTGKVYVTLFGDAETRTVELRDKRVNLQDGLQCSTGEFNYFYCRSFFRWPARLVYAESGNMESHFPNSLVSYSPFPANPALSSMEAHSGGELKTREVTLITERPLAHFWVQFHTPDLRLTDFEGAKPPTPDSAQ